MKSIVLNSLLVFSTLLNIGLVVFILKILRKSEDKTLEKLFSIGFPILIVSKDGNIVKTNDFAASFYGISKEELENKTVFDINTAGKEYLMEFIKRGLENSYQRCLFKHKTKYGEKRCRNQCNANNLQRQKTPSVHSRRHIGEGSYKNRA